MALNLADLFEHAADAFGDRLAATCGDTELTYQDLDQRVNRNTGGEKVFPEEVEVAQVPGGRAYGRRLP